MNPTLEQIVGRLPDPDAARRFAARLEAEQPRRFASLKPARLANLLTLASYSPWLGDALLLDPDGIDWPAEQRDLARARTKDELLELLARLALRRSGASEQELLSAFKNRELARIYLRDCFGIAPLTEITEELSDLADAILERAYTRVRQDLVNRYGVPQTHDERGRAIEAGFAVVSLGKLGSFELNYSSDVDLMFLYSGKGQTAPTIRGASAQSIDNHVFFTRLAEALVKLVGGAERGASVYRIDLRLRPYGREGDLAVRFERAVEYYRKLAQNWERQMLIRTRCSAGDPQLVTHFLAAVRDVVYHPEPPVEVVHDVRAAKEKIDKAALLRGGGFDVKLGPGGIREIEFVVQALQRAHGGRDPWVRAPRVLVGLQRLAEKDLLEDADRSTLSDAYTFLRTVEHRIQMTQGVQTHRLPMEPTALETLARRCSLDSAAQLQGELARHTSRVRGIWLRVMGDESREFGVREKGPAVPGPSSVVHAPSPVVRRPSSVAPGPVSPVAPAPSAVSPRWTADDGPNAPSPRLLRLLPPDWQPIVADAAARTINPVRALRNLEGFLASLATCDEEICAKALAGGAEKLDQLLRLLGSGSTFAEMLAAQPWLAGEIPSPALCSTTRTLEEFRARLDEAVSAETSLAPRMAALRRAWYRELIAVGSHDVLGGVELPTINREQTALAQASLEVACRLAEDEVASLRAALDTRPRYAILALGRLGHAGVDYDSDLDLLVVYERDASSASEELAVGRIHLRLAELVVRILSSLTREGMLYRVDYRLRPEGSAGQLASSLDRLTSYLASRAASWELTAYLKVRPVAGDAEFGEIARADIVSTIFEASRGKESLRDELRAMRLQLERERGRKGRNIKWGAGGMMDVYFATRYLQLRDEVDFPPELGTVRLVRHLERIGSLDASAAAAFAEGYGLLRRLDHYVRLIGNRHAASLPEAPEFVEEAAAATGFAGPVEFEAALASAMERVRETFGEIFEC